MTIPFVFMDMQDEYFATKGRRALMSDPEFAEDFHKLVKTYHVIYQDVSQVQCNFFSNMANPHESLHCPDGKLPFPKEYSVKVHRPSNGKTFPVDAKELSPVSSFLLSDDVNSIDFEYLLEELKKCDLLCANCHRIRHFGEDT